MSRRKEYDKERLEGDMEKIATTILIGCLSAFEKSFGDLFGYGLRYNQLTPEQKRFRKIWNETRLSILDRGHANIHKLVKLLDRYSVERRVFTHTFKLESYDE